MSSDAFGSIGGRSQSKSDCEITAAADACVNAVGRPPERIRTRRRQDFIRLIAEGVDPLRASKESEWPAHQALQTLSELYTIRVVEIERDAA